MPSASVTLHAREVNKKSGDIPPSQAYIVTRRDLIHHTDEEGRYHIIGVFATRKGAIKRAKQHVREELERVGGTSERYDAKTEYACAIRPRRIEEFQLNVEVEAFPFEDGADAIDEDEDENEDEDDDDQYDEDDEDEDRSIVELPSPFEDGSEEYNCEIQWRRPKRLWSDVEDDEENEEEVVDEEEEEEQKFIRAVENGIDGGVSGDWVVSHSQPGRKRRLLNDDEGPASRNIMPRCEP